MSAPLTTIDLKRLAAEVSVQHGIRMDADDPVMAVVTLNRLVFEEAVGQVLEKVQAAVRDFETATEKVQVRAGTVLAQEVRDASVVMRQEFTRAFKESLHGVPENRPVTTDRLWHDVLFPIICGLGLALGCLGLGFWFGALHHY